MSQLNRIEHECLSLRERSCGPQRTRPMLVRGEPLNCCPVDASRQGADCFVRVGGCEAAEGGTSGEIEQSLLDGGGPPGPEFGGGAFEIKPLNITGGKDHPRLANVQGGALFGYGDDSDCQGTGDRSMEASRTHTH
jgi:hypothetical protein